MCIRDRTHTSLEGEEDGNSTGRNPVNDEAHLSKNQKKKQRKKHKKKATPDQTTATADVLTSYPTNDSNDPDMIQITSLPLEEQKKISMQLKDKGNKYFKAKDYTNAIKYYNLALDLNKDPIFYSNISACYVSLGQLDKVCLLYTSRCV